MLLPHFICYFFTLVSPLAIPNSNIRKKFHFPSHFAPIQKLYLNKKGEEGPNYYFGGYFLYIQSVSDGGDQCEWPQAG